MAELDSNVPTPTVSIMMPAFNAEAFIRAAIESTLAQTCTDWELIIVDDGSQDRTAEIAASYLDARIRLVRQPNGGEAAARNTALQHARGRYLAFLDADDAYLPHHLEMTVACLETDPATGGVYTDGFYINQDGIPLKKLSARRRGRFEGQIFEPMVRASDVFGAPLCVVLRMEVIRQHNLDFDTRIVIGPDWDFLTRYAEWATFACLDEPTCLYRVHATNISNRTQSLKRRQSLALCREKAIHLESFKACSAETRYAVFYDLLIHLLADQPDLQAAITLWPEFHDLPDGSKAQLFRRMASEAVLRTQDRVFVQSWLQMARKLDPMDLRAVGLFGLYQVSPRLTRFLLSQRSTGRPAGMDTPFADLDAKVKN